jgi:DNA-binding IclR family transcriptional regulator
MPTNENNTSIKTLNRAMVIFDTLHDSNLPLGVNELAKKCKMNPSTVFRILKTLMEGGWVYQCEDDRYIIGPRFSFVTERKDFYYALKEISSFTMNRITTEESHAMNLVVLLDNKCTILQQSRTTKLIDLIPPVNSILPIHASASGKIIMAGLPIPLFNLYINNLSFEPFTNRTITDPTIFVSHIEKVRQDGYAIDHYESLENAFCIAVPILRGDGETLASLSFSGFIGSFDKNILAYYLPILRKAANEISQNLVQINQLENI